MAVRYIGTDFDGVDADASGDLWILREGFVLSAVPDAFDFLTFSSNKLVIEGSVFSDTDAIDSDATSSDNNVVVAATGTVYGFSDGVEMSGNLHEVINRGEITGLTDRGIQIIGDFGRVTNSGTIYGQSDGVSLEGDDNILINAGTITSEFDAVNISGDGSVVQNSGSLIGERHGVEFNTIAAETNSLFNTGTITTLGATAYAVFGDFGDESVINAGTLIGSVFLRDGNDFFDGRGGTVSGTVAGGAGDDVYVIDGPGTQIVELAAEGFDTVRTLSSANLGAFGEVERLELIGGADIDAEGNDENNQLIGNSGANSILGHAGVDRLEGNAGNDHLDGGASNDTVLGGDGDDWVAGGANSDLVRGDGGSDTVFGGDGDDRVLGDGAGFAGDDILIGGRGTDTLDGGGGTDTADYAADGGFFGVIVNLGLTTRYGVASGQARDTWRDTDTLVSVERIVGTDMTDKLVGSTASETFLGGAGADALLGDEGADTLDGGAGNDRLIGWRGADLLVGGEGDDTLLGDFDDDILQGGRGDDRIQGGAGRDLFLFENGFGEDRILDYNTTLEKLDFTGHSLVESIADLTITETAGSAVILDPEGNRLVLVGVAAATISAGDFLF